MAAAVAEAVAKARSEAEAAAAEAAEAARVEARAAAVEETTSLLLDVMYLGTVRGRGGIDVAVGCNASGRGEGALSGALSMVGEAGRRGGPGRLKGVEG